MTLAPTLITLDALAAGQSATVIHLAPAERREGEAGVDVSRRLMELGFVPGERIRMLKRGLPGGDPLAVKVGQPTFAFRRFEGNRCELPPGVHRRVGTGQHRAAADLQRARAAAAAAFSCWVAKA